MSDPSHDHTGFELALHNALRLSLHDRVLLAEKVLASVRDHLSDEPTHTHTQATQAEVRGVEVAPETLDEMRHEVWTHFPREEL